MGVPRIVARSVSELHGRVLHAVGAHEVFNPEEAMGQRLARRLAQPNVLEQLELGEGAELAEVGVPESVVGKSLIELEVRQKHAISVVAVRRGSTLKATLTGRERLESGDVLVVVGSTEAIARFAARA
jgi:trk system potassium uptake protein TrkA